MASLCFFVQLPDRTPILAKGVFLCTSSGRSLFWNHSPSEWFSKYKKQTAAKAVCFNYPHIFAFLLSKVGPDLLHALALCHVEGTAGIAVAAGDTIAGGLFQVAVMVMGQNIPRPGKVIVFIDKTHV